MNLSQARKKASLGYYKSTRKISFIERGAYKIFAPKSIADDNESFLDRVRYIGSPKMRKTGSKAFKDSDKGYRQSLNSSKLDIKPTVKLVDTHHSTLSTYKHLKFQSIGQKSKSPKNSQESSNGSPKLEIFNTSKFSKINKIPPKAKQHVKVVIKMSPMAIRASKNSDSDSSSNSSVPLFPKLSPVKFPI